MCRCMEKDSRLGLGKIGGLGLGDGGPDLGGLSNGEELPSGEGCSKGRGGCGEAERGRGGRWRGATKARRKRRPARKAERGGAEWWRLEFFSFPSTVQNRSRESSSRAELQVDRTKM